METEDIPAIERTFYEVVHEFWLTHFGDDPVALVVPAKTCDEYMKTSRWIKYQAFDKEFRPKFMGIPIYGRADVSSILALGKGVDLSEWGIAQ